MATAFRCPVCERCYVQTEHFRIHWGLAHDGDAPDAERFEIG